MSKIIELKLPSRIESVDESALLAEKIARDWGYTDDFISSIDLAVRESVANAVKHGNKFDDGKEVEVVFAETSDGIEIKVRDFGVAMGVGPEKMQDHLKLIPRQVAQIAKEDPKVLDSFDNFVEALVGPK